MVDTVRKWIDGAWPGHGSLVYIIGAAVLLLGAISVWLWWRRGQAHSRVGFLAIALATAFAAEGMWEVARESLGLDVVRSIVLFAMFEVVMVHQGLMAKYKLRLDPPKPVGRHLKVVWAVAAASGVVSSLNSANVAEFLLRLLAPLVAAMIFWMDLTADKDTPDGEKLTWQLSLSRIAVWLKMARPGHTSLTAEQQKRREDKMALLAHRLHNGHISDKNKAKIRAKLAKMSLHVSDDAVARIQHRVDRASRVEKLTRPAAIDALSNQRSEAAAAPAVRAAAEPAAPATGPADVSPTPDLGAVVGATPMVPSARRPAGETPTSPAAGRPKAEETGRRATVGREAGRSEVPRTAAKFEQWLTIWKDMQAAPGATNAELAERHEQSERTITNIRRAGKEGALTDEHLLRLRGVSTSAAAPDHRSAPIAAQPADDDPRPAGPVPDDADPGSPSRDRDEALVG